MKKLIKTGDILLFKPAKHNFIDQCVAKITNSEVCHTAMAYSDNSLVEINAAGIGVYSIEEKPGDSVIVMRLESEPDPSPLIKAANAYLDSKLHFNYSSMIMLAGLLLYRNKTQRNDLDAISDKIICAACNEMKHLLMQSQYKKTPAMVCSQLAYQIYYNGGADYKIKLEDGILLSDTDMKQQSGALMGTSSLDIMDTAENASEDAQVLAKELLSVLDTPYTEPLQPIFGTPMHNYIFNKQMVEIMEKAEVKLAPESMFITSEDILNHSLNLKMVGKCDIRFKH